jgi:hypothetical protein
MLTTHRRAWPTRSPHSKNTTATFDVLANDSSAPDPAEDLTIDSASLVQPTNGTVSVSENGKRSATPLNNVVGRRASATACACRGQLSPPVTANVTVQDFVPGSLAGFVLFRREQQRRQGRGRIVFTGVTITLTGTATAGNNTNVNLTAKTGDDGLYKFENLAPGNYTLAELTDRPSPLMARIRRGPMRDGFEGRRGQCPRPDRDQRLRHGTNGTNNNFGEQGRTAATISRATSSRRIRATMRLPPSTPLAACSSAR